MTRSSSSTVTVQVYCLVEERQQLGAEQRRSQDLMFVASRGLFMSEANGDVRERR